MFIRILRSLLQKILDLLGESNDVKVFPVRHHEYANNVFNVTVNIHNNVQNNKKTNGGSNMDEFIGTVKLFAGNYSPEGWFLCDGRLLQISQYSALFSVIGTAYGGDGRATFALPDMRGRVAVGAGRGNGLTGRQAGEIFGEERCSLKKENMPIQASDPVLPAPGVANHSVTDMQVVPFEILQPSIGMNYIICWRGEYPVRE